MCAKPGAGCAAWPDSQEKYSHRLQRNPWMMNSFCRGERSRAACSRWISAVPTHSRYEFGAPGRANPPSRRNARACQQVGTTLEHLEDAAPAHNARMQQDACVRDHSVADMSRIPIFLRRVNGQLQENGRPNYILFWPESPLPAVIGIVAVIAHHKIFALGNGYRTVVVERVGRRRAVRFIEFLAVDIHHAFPNLDLVVRQSDQALDVIRISGKR